MNILSDAELLETKKVLDEHGGHITNAAEALGIARSTLQSRIQRLGERGLTGMEVANVPPGLAVTGLSTYYQAHEGRPAQWIKTRVDRNFADITASIEEVSRTIKPFRVVPEPKALNKDLATFYIIADQHLGMYAWKDEAGDDYDTEIGRRDLLTTMSNLIERSPNSDTAVVLNLGDFFHSDSNENRTRRSGNSLDVDTRYARVLDIGVELLIQTVQMALTKHQRVHVRNVQGNHDPYATLALNAAVKAFFAENPRVFVESAASPFFFFRWGKVLVASTHGDMIKAQDMPGVVAAYRAEDWGQTEYRYIYLGHVHHKSIGGGEHHGAVWETFQTLAPKDSWHRASGYSSGRSMVAITHHRDSGEWDRNIKSIAGPK
jgi:predicted transcriptional regulator